MDITGLNPSEWQGWIDGEIARRGLGEYVEYVRYIPQGGDVPPDATHVLSLRSTRSGADVVVALKAKGVYAVLVDAVLAIV